jgi:hypothetical protein
MLSARGRIESKAQFAISVAKAADHESAYRPYPDYALRTRTRIELRNA